MRNKKETHLVFKEKQILQTSSTILKKRNFLEDKNDINGEPLWEYNKTNKDTISFEETQRLFSQFISNLNKSIFIYSIIFSTGKVKKNNRSI